MVHAARTVIRLLVSMAAIAVAVVMLHDVGAAFGTMPDCGRGTYFLYPAPLMLRLLVTALGVAVIISVVVVVTGPGPRWILMAALVVAATIAAGTGAAWSEVAHGCDVEGSGYATFAAGATLVIGTLVASVVGGIRAAMHPARRLDGAFPMLPPSSRALGTYRVQRSAVDGVTNGELVWLALTAERLLVLCTDGIAGTVDRDGLRVERLDGTATLTSDGWPLMVLEALAGTDLGALVAALEAAA